MNDNTLSLIALADQLEKFILNIIPTCKTVSKYGGTLFTVRPEEKEGQFCGVFIYKQHVHMAFSRGTELQDPKNLLSGTGKQRRHINYASADEVDFAALENFLTQAAELS